MRHRAKIRADRSNRFFKMAVVRHLGFSFLFLFFKFQISTDGLVRWPICITVPNFVPIGQTVAGIWSFFDFLRWRPSAILYLFYACLDHQRSVVGSRCAKFGWNRHCTFEDVRFLTFCTLRLKMPIHAPFWGKMGENGHFLQFYLSGNTITWD